MHSGWLIVFCVLSAMISPLPRADSELLIPLKPNKRKMKGVWETYYEKVPVGGGVKEGIVAIQRDSPIIPKSFFSRIPAHTYKILHVEISSKDGRYAAELIYDLDSGLKGDIEFELPTQYLSTIKSYPKKDLAILAKLTNDSSGKDYQYVVSAWEKNDFDVDYFYVFLLAESPVFVRLKDDPTRRFDCEPISGRSLQAYDTQCKLPMRTGERRYEIMQKIPRRPSGYMLIPLPLTIIQ